MLVLLLLYNADSVLVVRAHFDAVFAMHLVMLFYLSSRDASHADAVLAR